MKIAAVVPTCRSFTIPEQTVPVNWIIVHDKKHRPVIGECEDIVAPDSELFGVGCDSIRAAGFVKACEDSSDVILTADDDCRFPVNWAEQHAGILSSEVHPWSSTVHPYRVRGVPYLARRKAIAVTHGLWDGIPDLDARTQQQVGLQWLRINEKWAEIHPPFPQCSMNLGFRREVAPVMYQPAQGENTPFNRFADIWGGLLGQAVLRDHNYAYMNGGAVVYHQRASDPEKNRIAEKPGMEEHEKFWQYVWKWRGLGESIADDYEALSYHVERYGGKHGQYFKRLGRNMRRWLEMVG